jgi:hypothetical protein
MKYVGKEGMIPRMRGFPKIHKEPIGIAKVRY